METQVTTGKSKTGRFATPEGDFFLRRIIENPWYYPPKWYAKLDGPQKSGKNNPYGLWMAEICYSDKPGTYEFGFGPDDTSFRMHSTNSPMSIGGRTSHGCIRLHPDAAQELYSAILHFSEHKAPRKTYR